MDDDTAKLTDLRKHHSQIHFLAMHYAAQARTYQTMAQQIGIEIMMLEAEIARRSSFQIIPGGKR